MQSSAVMTASLPVVVYREMPRPLMKSLLAITSLVAPLWPTRPIGPGPGSPSTDPPANTLRSSEKFMKPRQLGPRSRTSFSRQKRLSSSCLASPPAPVSA